MPQSEVQQPEPTTVTTMATNTTQPVSYHDIVKEPEEPQTQMERIIENQELAELDQESEALLKETDDLIVEDELKLLDEDEMDISMDIDGNQTNLEQKIQILEKKLDQLEKRQM